MNFSPEKLLLVGIIALVVLGPHRLPRAARTLGRFVADLRRISTSFQSEVGDALAEPRDALTGAVGDLGLTDVGRSLHDRVTGAVLGRPTAGANDGAGANGSARSGNAEPAEQSAASNGVGGAEAVVGATDVPPAPEDPSFN